MPFRENPALVLCVKKSWIRAFGRIGVCHMVAQYTCV